MVSYPKWLYHPTEAARIVQDEAAHKALGAGWVESPADVRSPLAEARAFAERVDKTVNEAADILEQGLAPMKPSKKGK